MTYYPAEALAESPRPFTFEQVCQVAEQCQLPAQQVGAKRFRKGAEAYVYRLYAIEGAFEDRTQAYSAAGEMGRRIALDGGRMPGFGQVCVLESFSPASPGMERSSIWA